MKFRILGAPDAMISTPQPLPTAMAGRMEKLHLNGARERVHEVSAEVQAERPWSDRWWKKVAKLNRVNIELLGEEKRNGA
jgi:hypothetical protein